MLTAQEETFYRNLKSGAPPVPAEDDETSPVVEAEPPEEPSQSQGARPVPFTAKNIFGHPDTHPLLLDIVLLNKYGAAWLGWEPETVWAEIEDDFKQSISVHARNKIQALRTCHAVTTPWEAWGVFNVVCQAFNNNVPNFRILQKPSIAQLVVAVDIMKRIRDAVFSDEVEIFIATCFLDEGVSYLPPPVDFAQERAARPMYRCTACGKIDIDTENDMCDLCGAPASKLVRSYTHDPAPIAKRYAQRLANSDILLEENPVDVPVARLILAHEYHLYRRRQLEEQLKVVKHAQL